MKYGLIDKEDYLIDSVGQIISDYWGYSDGKVFKMSKYGNNKLYRKGNTFEFFNVHANSLWIPYQIDMETGEIY